MSATENAGASDAAMDPGYYENAREYALDRLDEKEPTSPAELSEEYGCTGDHARQTLAELADEGVVERVSRGNYTLDDAVEDGKDALSDAADTATDALGHIGVGDSDADELEDAPAPALPMEPKKLGMLLAIGLVLWLLFRATDSGDGDTGAADVEDDQDGFDGGLAG